jgi:hypothetical protein
MPEGNATDRLGLRRDTEIFCVMLPNTVSEITHPADGVISSPTSKPLIVLAFDQSSRPAQGLP